MLVVNKDTRHLYKLWNVFYDGTQWYGGSGAFFDMNPNDRRPEVGRLRTRRAWQSCPGSFD